MHNIQVGKDWRGRRRTRTARAWRGSRGTHGLRLPGVGRILRALLALFVLVLAGLILLFRSQSPFLLAVVRQFNKHFLNPAMLLLAGHRGWYASVARHVGRRTGRPYATPIVAEPTANGFVIPLPYGTGVDWLCNVLAAGQFTLERNGVTYTVGEPVLLPRAEAQTFLSSSRRFAFRLYGVKEFLKVTTLSTAPVSPEQE